MTVSLHEMRTRWSLEDLLDANLTLDLWAELERKSAEAAKE